jgi:hypothetical protein
MRKMISLQAAEFPSKFVRSMASHSSTGLGLKSIATAEIEVYGP